MNWKAVHIAEFLGGAVEGNPEVTVNRPAKIEEGEEGTISFLAHPKYEHWAYSSKASILLVANDFCPTAPISSTLIRVADVYQAISKLYTQFQSQQTGPALSTHPSASIHPTAIIGQQVSVGAFVVIEAGAVIADGVVLYPQVYVGQNVNIAEGTILYPGVKVYHSSRIGKSCILHANAVIGSDGFGFAPDGKGAFQKIPQLGHVIIEDDVEIGANTVIDRASVGATIIRSGAKLDNLVQIAHNVEIGSGTAIAAQVGIAGSTKIGKRVLIGGQAGFVGHIQVADDSKIQAQSGVGRDIKTPGSAVYGSPAIGYTEYQKSYAVFKQLPDLLKRIHQLEQRIKELENPA